MINLTRAHQIVVVSQALKDELIARNIAPHKILVNPNGVDVDSFNPALFVDKRVKLRAELQTQDKFIVCFVGSFQPWHGVDMIAKMAPSILGQHQHVVMLLIGDGPLKPMLQQQFIDNGVCDNQYIFTGLIPQHKIANYLAIADLFISPTQPNPDGTTFFGSPTKLFEYMSFGKPIIASDLGQLREVINPAYKVGVHAHVTNEIGVLVEPTNTQGFIRAMHELITMPEEQRARMGCNARAKAIQEYQWKTHVLTIIQHQRAVERHGKNLS